MRFIPTRIHAFVDYAMGVLLIVAPWLFGFAAGGAETWVPVILGLGTIAYSLFTDYELGVVKRIPMTTHLGLDAGSGVILAASPWIFGFYDLVYVPHLILGLLEIGAALTTRTVPYVDGRPAEERPAHITDRPLLVGAALRSGTELRKSHSSDPSMKSRPGASSTECGRRARCAFHDRPRYQGCNPFLDFDGGQPCTRELESKNAGRRVSEATP